MKCDCCGAEIRIECKISHSSGDSNSELPYSWLKCQLGGSKENKLIQLYKAYSRWVVEGQKPYPLTDEDEGDDKQYYYDPETMGTIVYNNEIDIYEAIMPSYIYEDYTRYAAISVINFKFDNNGHIKILKYKKTCGKLIVCDEDYTKEGE
jgi:hypothetical protein